VVQSSVELVENKIISEATVSAGKLFATPGPGDSGDLRFTLVTSTSGIPDPLRFILRHDSQEVIRMGRCPKKNHVVINHPGISNLHAELKLLPGATADSYVLGICDRSSNGTGLQLPDCESVAQLEKGVDTPLSHDLSLVFPIRVKAQGANSAETRIHLALCIHGIAGRAPSASDPPLEAAVSGASGKSASSEPAGDQSLSVCTSGGAPILPPIDDTIHQSVITMTSFDVYGAARAKSKSVIPPGNLAPLGIPPQACVPSAFVPNGPLAPLGIPPKARVPSAFVPNGPPQSKFGKQPQHVPLPPPPAVSKFGFVPEPKRCGPYGGANTYREFVQHYGVEKAQYMWQRAPVASLRRSEPVSTSAKRFKGFDGNMPGTWASAGGC